MNERAAEILDFWFAGSAGDPALAAARNGFWYGGGSAADEEIGARFGAILAAAKAGECDEWLDDAREALALVIVLDQFPRNVWRGTARAFSCDELALARSRAAIEGGYLTSLTPVQCAFLMMPFQHSELLAVQRESLRLFADLAETCAPQWRAFAGNSRKFAEKHMRIIERFGRFPHRNAVLGREPSEEELRWLEAGGDTFGQ